MHSFPRRRACLSAALLILLESGVASAASSATAVDKQDQAIEVELAHLGQKFDVEVQRALNRIDGLDRRLLAARSYLRAQDTLAARWSWTQQEIETYQQSAAYRDMLAELQRVAAEFARLHPGYTLRANSQVRSLDVQIKRWNENRSVGVIAHDLRIAARSQLPQSIQVSESAAAQTRQRLRKLLLNWQPKYPPPLAAPGLSLHGRARALDFQIYRDGRMVAGPDTTTIAAVWIGEGWARKLATAVKAASTKFRGPLTMPNEPWHFEYQP